MSKIFLSYRRDDSAAYAGRLYDRLAAHFGKEQIFMDIDHIEPGEDFVDIITNSVGASSVLILIIGRQWASPLDPNGARRLDNPDDFVRLELSAALDKRIRVIPVLVGGASVPRVQDLPAPFQPLARRQAIDISDTRFHSDVDRLIETIEKGLSAATAQGARAATANAVSEVRSPERTPQLQAPVLDAQSVGGLKEYFSGLGANLKIVLAAVGVVVVVVTVGVLALRNSSDTGPANELNRQTATVAETTQQAAPESLAYKGPALTLRVQDGYPTKYAHSAAFRAVADTLNKTSSGSINLEVLPAGAVVPTFATMDAVATGALDSAWVSPGYFYGKNTAFAVIEGPPFGPNPSRYAQWRRDKNVHATIDSLYRSFGVKSVFCGVIGPYADLWSTLKISAPSDLSKRKLRATGIRIDLFTTAGAAVSVLPIGEIVAAMDRRVIDAAHFVEPASGVEAAGLDEMTKFLYYPGTITPAAGLDLIVNAGKWDQLPREAQAVLEQACARNVQQMLDKNDAEQRPALSSLTSKGVRIEPLPAPVVSALRTAWQKVIAEKSSNPLFLKLLDSTRPYEKGG